MRISRRKFLDYSGRAAVGLTIGFPLDCFAQSSAVDATKVFQPNAYIRIGSDNVVRLWATRSEMGQGVRTLLPMVLADELGADWEKILIEQASPGPPFKNIRLRTSGSGSAAGTWRPLRVAAAAAREMLISAAAKKWNTDVKNCRAQDGSVVHLTSGRKLTFGELAAAAALLPVPPKPAVKKSSDLELIGKPVKRRDGASIVSGKAVYGVDVRIAGMLQAVVARCPYLGGKLVSCDPAPALKIAGVRHVVPVKRGFSQGVAIVAVNTWTALKGRQALHPIWDNGPDSEFDSSTFTRQLEDSLSQSGYPIRRQGDAPAVLAASRNKLEALYEYPFQAHAPLETMNCTAHVQEAACEIWVPTQCPEVAQQETAEFLGIPVESVKVNITLLGGGFGRRLVADYVREAVEISRAVRLPVQVLWTRDDDMKHGFFHPPRMERLQAGLDDHGFPVAWMHKSAGPFLSILGTPTAEQKKNPSVFADMGMPWGLFDNPYNLQNHWGDFVPVDSPVPTGPWRAVMYPSTVFARESFLDEIAHAATIDPLELRLRLLEPGDVLDLKDHQVERARLVAVLKLVAEKSAWSQPLNHNDDGRLHGRGMACNVYDEDCYLAQVAEISISPDLSDLKVRRIVSAVDCGLVLSPLGVEAQTESAIAWGMTAALGGRITFKSGQAQEHSYSDFKVPRMNDAPMVETYFRQGSPSPGGFGETAVPTVAPAITNAIFAATGKRVRRLPVTPEKLATA
ncbi:MAG TPA: molybdopterin cofactor-binding domain-containing protein [Candidatus Angelobacter sp.]